MPQEISFNYDFKIEFASGGGDRSSLIGKIDNERELKNALMKLKDDMNYEDLTNKITLAIIAHNKTKSTTFVFVPRHNYLRVILIKNKSEESL
jgi:hypothetical protein